MEELLGQKNVRLVFTKKSLHISILIQTAVGVSVEKRRLFWRLDTGNKVVLNSLSHLNFGSQGRYPVKDGFFRALPKKKGGGMALPEFFGPFSLSYSSLIVSVIRVKTSFLTSEKKDQVARIGVMGGGLGDSGNARKKMFFFR